MHPAIAEHSSKTFYNGRIRSGVPAAARPLLAGIAWPNESYPVVFVNVQGAELNRRLGRLDAKSELDDRTQPAASDDDADATEPAAADDDADATGPAADGVDAAEPISVADGVGGATAAQPAAQQPTSYANAAEADAVSAIARALLASGELPATSLGVITPYSAQANLLLQRRLGGGEVEVSSVDGFQGREKEAIIFSAVRSNDERAVGFLADRRRLNVAITRAKRGLVLVGDAQTLSAAPVWRDYIRALRKKGCVLETVDALLRAI
jgi:superfamily I DNA and/or RNA helicase